MATRKRTKRFGTKENSARRFSLKATFSDTSPCLQRDIWIREADLRAIRSKLRRDLQVVNGANPRSIQIV